ncbi:MAG: squalene/phytoene synthase family protein [Pseudomonadota bacterium]
MQHFDKATTERIRHELPDFYTATLFAPKRKRLALLSLYSFHAELARIATSVSEPMLGEIKLQWWRDALQNAEQKVQIGHPVADNFAKVIKNYNIPKVHIANMIDARSFDLSDEPMPDEQSLKIYLNKTYGGLFLISAYILKQNFEDRKRLEKAGYMAGFAYGLTELLCTLPFQAARMRLSLPLSCLEDDSFSINQIHTEYGERFLKKAITFFEQDIKRDFKDLQNTLSEFPEHIIPAFLPACLVTIYLKQIVQKNHNPTSDIIRINPLQRLFKYWSMCAFGSI